MECKSSPSSQRNWEHDVFLSFSGEDTRNNFTDHLFAALQRKGISTFKDDVKVHQGEAISPQLLKAIERSRIFVVIFSRNYARSTWCLEELAKIADCIKQSEIRRAESIESVKQTAFPIFYDVYPSEVRKQSGVYEKPFIDLEIKFKENMNRWRAAMTEVANISGWHVQKRPESKIIDDIIKRAISILGYKCSSFADDLVGIQSRAKELESLLNLGSEDDVRVVGICGMSGIGKTTLAAVVYDRISHQFDACSFLVDISKVSNYDRYGQVRLQEQILRETVNEENTKIWDPYNGAKLISSKLRHLKTLIVLDDVDDENQLETLVRKRGWFGAGSRVIITSRNEHILKQYGVNEVYRVKLLNQHEALELLCRRAFKKDKPSRDYEKLTYCVLHYVKGLPLAIKVLGSFLFGRKVSEWTCFLNRMQESPEPKIVDVLRASLDGLVESEREIFLDIACFFNGKKEGQVKLILECCGFYPEIGINVLIDRSLLTIFRKEYVRMHDMLQELGKKIVQENYPNEPEKWSRLWLYKDLQHVIMRNKETNDVNAMVLELEDTEETPILRVEVLSKMSCLRLLILRNVKFSGSLNYFPNGIKYLSWHKYPFTYFPPSYQPKSSIEHIWRGIKPLSTSQPFQNLRSFNLSHSKALVETPHFSWLPNIEILRFEGCTKLSQVHPSIGLLHNLSYLNLSFCKNLVSLPSNLSMVSSLKSLELVCCSKLKRTPNFRGLSNLEVLNLWGCRSLLELDNSIGVLSKLQYLNLSGCRSLVSIPSSIFDLSSLVILCALDCTKLLNMPNETRHAEGLDASGTIGQSIPISLTSFSTVTSALTGLELSYCNICQVPNAIGDLHCLEDLSLDGNNFITLPCTIKNLYGLKFFSLKQCKNLESLPELPMRMLVSSMERGQIRSVLVGLYIFDCPKLAKNESYSSLALPWIIISLQEPDVRKLNPFFGVVIPGSEIPWWFKHRSSTPSIRIQVPPNVQDKDNNWLGLALCVTFVVHDPHLPTDDGFGNMIFPINCYLNGYEELPLNIGSIKRPFTVELDHLWLIHIEWDNVVFEVIEETNFIHVEFTAQPGVEVKKCAFRWIYKESVERLKPRMKQCTSNNMQIDDADDFGIYDSISTLFVAAENWS